MRQTCWERQSVSARTSPAGNVQGEGKKFLSEICRKQKGIEFRDPLVATLSWQLDSHLSQLQTQHLSHSSLWRKSVFLANFQLALELNRMA